MRNTKKNAKTTPVRNLSILPGESLSPIVIEQLKQINSTKTQKKKSFLWYKTEIGKLFGCTECRKNIYKSVKYKTFYGGFVVGEGSINVSIKKSPRALFGVLVDPEFSITQHVNGFGFLFAALTLFETGSIHYKSGSNGTLVYRIENRKSLSEKVVPFWETYILPYQSIEEKKRLLFFRSLLLFLEQKKHKDLFFFVNQILPLWDKLRKQKGQINQSFPDLEAATDFVVKNSYKQKKGSSETTRDRL